MMRQLSKIERNETIKSFKKKNLSYKEIGDKFHLTLERIRQIVLDKSERCEEHQRLFTGKCRYCESTKLLKKQIRELEIKMLPAKLRDLFLYSRNKDKVIERALLIRKLKKEGYSFSQIGRIIGRHHTSVINLYNKYE